MIRLIGGPHDGAEGEPENPVVVGVPTLWVLRDPLYRAPNGLILSQFPCNAPRYEHVGSDNDMELYEFAGWFKPADSRSEPLCA